MCDYAWVRRARIGRSDLDREFRDFILGAVATAGGRNPHEKPLPAYLQ